MLYLCKNRAYIIRNIPQKFQKKYSGFVFQPTLISFGEVQEIPNVQNMHNSIIGAALLERQQFGLFAKYYAVHD